MPITTIDPQSALVLIDLQKGIVGMPTIHPTAQVVAQAVRLVQAFRQHRRPIVFVHVYWAPDFSDAVKTRNQSGIRSASSTCGINISETGVRLGAGHGISFKNGV